jgi:anhydro-N-acetylmuramic acid kinase
MWTYINFNYSFINLTNFNPMNAPSNYPMIGLMSGTSGDGLDLVFATFTKKLTWDFELHFGKTISFPRALHKALVQAHKLPAQELEVLDVEFGRWMGEMVKNVCDKEGISPMAIASHGHTVFHQPLKKITKQIGNGWAMHVASAIPVITDFRMHDVQLGGEGAPLVPIGDLLLFPEVDFCLNLGGIANISIKEKDKILAFDICPFNLLLNHFAQKLGKDYDEDGEIAKTAHQNPRLLEQLEQLPYYERSGARSLGREDIEREFLPLLEESKLQPQEVLATLITHYVSRIAASLENKQGKLMPTGGGAFNSYFIEQLRRRLGGRILVELPATTLISLKEALVFGFLGALRLRGEPNSLASVSGAFKDNCGGVIYGL